MLDHVAVLVGVGLVPLRAVVAKAVVASVDEEDVILADGDPLLARLRGVDLVVAGRVREVDVRQLAPRRRDRRGSCSVPVGVRLLAPALPAVKKVDLAVQVGAQVVRMS